MTNKRQEQVPQTVVDYVTNKRTEYVEQKRMESVPQERVEMVPVEREEQVPVERVEYVTREYEESVPVERSEMVPVQVQDMVTMEKVIQRPVERQEEIVEYVAVTRSIVHHHKADGTVQDMRMSQMPAGANVVSENRVQNTAQVGRGIVGGSQVVQSSKPSMKSVHELVGGQI